MPMLPEYWNDPILTVAVPLFVVSFTLEGIFITRHLKKEYNIKDAVASVSMGIGSAFINLALKIPVPALFPAAHNRWHR